MNQRIILTLFFIIAVYCTLLITAATPQFYIENGTFHWYQIHTREATYQLNSAILTYTTPADVESPRISLDSAALSWVYLDNNKYKHVLGPTKDIKSVPTAYANTTAVEFRPYWVVNPAYTNLLHITVNLSTLNGYTWNPEDEFTFSLTITSRPDPDVILTATARPLYAGTQHKMFPNALRMPRAVLTMPPTTQSRTIGPQDIAITPEFLLPAVYNPGQRLIAALRVEAVGPWSFDATKAQTQYCLVNDQVVKNIVYSNPTNAIRNAMLTFDTPIAIPSHTPLSIACHDVLLVLRNDGQDLELAATYGSLAVSLFDAKTALVDFAISPPANAVVALAAPVLRPGEGNIVVDFVKKSADNKKNILNITRSIYFPHGQPEAMHLLLTNVERSTTGNAVYPDVTLAIADVNNDNVKSIRRDNLSAADKKVYHNTDIVHTTATWSPTVLNQVDLNYTVVRKEKGFIWRGSGTTPMAATFSLTVQQDVNTEHPSIGAILFYTTKCEDPNDRRKAVQCMHHVPLQHDNTMHTSTKDNAALPAPATIMPSLPSLTMTLDIEKYTDENKDYLLFRYTTNKLPQSTTLSSTIRSIAGDVGFYQPIQQPAGTPVVCTARSDQGTVIKDVTVVLSDIVDESARSKYDSVRFQTLKITTVDHTETNFVVTCENLQIVALWPDSAQGNAEKLFTDFHFSSYFDAHNPVSGLHDTAVSLGFAHPGVVTQRYKAQSENKSMYLGFIIALVVVLVVLCCIAFFCYTSVGKKACRKVTGQTGDDASEWSMLMYGDKRQPPSYDASV